MGRLEIAFVGASCPMRKVDESGSTGLLADEEVSSSDELCFLLLRRGMVNVCVVKFCGF